MKNRLGIARNLLSRDGTIAISVDNYELGYLLVLLDEVFGRENRKNVCTVKRGSVTGAKVINPGVVNIVEYVVLYSKDTTTWKPNRIYSAKGVDDRYGNFILNYDKGREHWSFTTVLEAFASLNGCKKSQLKSKLGSDYDTLLETFVIENAAKVCQFATLDDNNISQEARELKQESITHPNELYYLERDDGKPYIVVNGKLILFASDRIMKIDGKETFSQPITDIWDDVLPNDIHNEGGVVLKKGKKPEKLLERIISLCTGEGDLVVDFFAGSGTTGAVALKTKRKFILCEQMDYIETITTKRLVNTINGDARGISVNYDWQGGGSFVYCELAKCNQQYVDEVAAAKTDAELTALLEHVLKSGFISSKVNPADIIGTAADFEALSLDDKKRFILELLDKNMLYVNLCDIDDEEYAISDADKAFTRSFYGLGGDSI
jgi:adenine-specific DNA-methyltransferase